VEHITPLITLPLSPLGTYIKNEMTIVEIIINI